MKKIFSKFKGICQKDACNFRTELEYYVNRHLENDEKWKLIFELISKIKFYKNFDDYFPELLRGGSQIFSASSFALVIYEHDLNLKNRVYFLENNEESEFLKTNIFNHYRYYDARDDLMLILKHDFLILPINNQENEYGYMFLRFKNNNDATDNVYFLQMLCENIGFAIEQMNLYETLRDENKKWLQFIAEFSHELKTPLNAVVGYMEILKENIEKLDTKSAQCVINATIASLQLRSLLTDLIESAKIYHGKLRFRREDFCTRTAITNAVEVFRAKISEKNISVEPILTDLRICSDSTKFKQVVYNLISNAVKFSSQNGKIRILTWCDEENFHFEISDNGCGLQKEEVEKIFGFMYQAESNYMINNEGSGIGLAFCKKVVELQGGQIKLTSEPNEGTTFSFSLPLDG